MKYYIVPVKTFDAILRQPTVNGQSKNSIECDIKPYVVEIEGEVKISPYVAPGIDKKIEHINTLGVNSSSLTVRHKLNEVIDKVNSIAVPV